MNMCINANTLGAYKFIGFDSDGVILDSNDLKLRVFQELAKDFGAFNADNLIKNYIVSNKGSTRKQILSFISVLLTSQSARISEQEAMIKLLHQEFGNRMREELLHCKVTQALPYLRNLTSNSVWFVITSGDEEETRFVYGERKIDSYFDAGIYGSPLSKQENIQLLKNVHPGIEHAKVVYIGDSISDLKFAQDNGYDFILVSEWSHCIAVAKACRAEAFPIVSTLESLC